MPPEKLNFFRPWAKIVQENKDKIPASSFTRFASFLLAYSVHKPKILGVSQVNFVKLQVFYRMSGQF